MNVRLDLVQGLRQALLPALEKTGELAALLEALPWTDFEVYRMLAYFIRKRVVQVE